MRAAVVSESGTLSIHERERPSPSEEEVLIDVAACGLCGGDEPVLAGSDGIEYPRIPGHEIAGEVAAVGSDVAVWDVGDSVAVGWHGGHCFDCDQCRRGSFTTCCQKAVTGISRDGGLAEYTLARAEALCPVPDAVAPRMAGPLCCAGLTAYNALRNSDARAGDVVAIQGIGGVGHMGVQVADAMGFETVALSRGPAKRESALGFGASSYIDTSTTDPAAALQEYGGATAILGTAPNAEALSSLVGGLAPDGDLIVVGAPEEPLQIEVGPLLNDRLSVRGWSSGHGGDAADMLAFAVEHDLRPSVDRFELGAVDEAVECLTDGDPRFRVVVEP